MTPPASSYALPLPAAAARPDKNAMAARKVAARKRRVVVLRRRVVALAVAVFLAVWGVIFVQLAAGHDPALTKTTTTATKAATATKITATSTASPTTSTAASVTTRQS
jgi:cytoskeletal protein RodZ